ncbi:hypothetical protein LDENG_00081470 [Lucifuga dentata]|nr:hypothetical protein LDENG_00081470 [Lucifuga dentata]
MEDTPAASISMSFNNRALFGYIQVAKIMFWKLSHLENDWGFLSSIKHEVKKKFDFFEWYLTYSMVDEKTLEPHYFWMDVVICYESYTKKSAAQSTSFPGLLGTLYCGLCMSKKSHPEAEKTTDDLKTIQDDLKRTYDTDPTDVNAAERYILSNIILSNRMSYSPQLTPVKELQIILHYFLKGVKDVKNKSPEFYLLVLLLFWPETVKKQKEECATQPCYVSLMKEAFDAKYGKFLRGRYLLPLFFLGKGCGLSRWVHKSRLDAILETKVMQVNEMWSDDEVWKTEEIQDILLPVRVEPCTGEQTEAHACVVENKIKVSIKVDPNAPFPTFVYLGFTIQGPVVFTCLQTEHLA